MFGVEWAENNYKMNYSFNRFSFLKCGRTMQKRRNNEAAGGGVSVITGAFFDSEV